MGKIMIFGLGYTASVLAGQLAARGWQVASTGARGTMSFDDTHAVAAALASASHVLSSVPPLAEAQGGEDPVLARYGAALRAGAASGQWLGYLSSTGVYGDCGGAWVDESAATVGFGGTGRRTARAAADAAWGAMGALVFRLPGIYGPPLGGHRGRSAFDRLAQGRAHRIMRPGQVFSRIHVEDISHAIIAAINTSAPPRAYNIADDAPCHPNLVIEEACRIARLPLPPLLAPDDPALSTLTRGFYDENRRIAATAAHRILGWRPAYPTWREGLAAIWAAICADMASASL